MPPTFNFLKNLANHQVKAPSPNQQTESTFSNHDHGDSSPNKLRRKSKKSTKGHILPVTTSSRQMDAFGGILGHEVDDIGPSRYPAHPFQSIPGSVGNHYLNPNEVRSPDKFSQGLPRSDNSWSHTKEHPPVMQSHSLYDTMPHHNHDFHTSTPHPPELGQRRHEANTANSFVTPDETPIVSQYTANGVQHGQTPSEVPPPSRSWSPIPSVHRASVDDDEPYSENHEHDVPREVGNQSWITDGNLGNRFSADITDPRISTMADLGQPDSMSIHTIHYVEYPQERSPQAAIPRSMPERWEIPPSVPRNENSARSQPSQTYLQPPLPQPPPVPLPRQAHMVVPNTPHSPLREHPYWGEDDPEVGMYRYIIPAGLKFVFQDQEGNIIARIGKDGRVEDLGQSSKSAPIVIEDERGRELYRSKNLRGPSPTPRELRQGHFRTHVRSVYEEHNMDFGGDEVIATLDAGGYRRRPPWLSQPSSISSKSTKTILIDEKGNQFVIKSPSLHGDGRRVLENHDTSYQAQVSYA